MGDKLKIFKMNDTDWVVAHSKKQAVEFYGEMYGAECVDIAREIDYDEEFWIDLSDESLGKKPAKWFLENKKYDIPDVIFSTEF